MCCSIRAAVFFLASVHIYFAITQMINVLPLVVTNIKEEVLASTLEFIFCIGYFAVGFMTFRGADEESGTLIKIASFTLFFLVVYRFVLMGLDLMLLKKLPEAVFLYVYTTPVIPIIYVTLLYLVYVSLLFCYHNELSHIASTYAQSQAQCEGTNNQSERRNNGSGRRGNSSPLNYRNHSSNDSTLLA